MSNPKGMVVKVLLAYGPDCDWSMAWLAGLRLAVSSARKAWCDATTAGRCHPLPRSRCSGSGCVGGEEGTKTMQANGWILYDQTTLKNIRG